MLEVLGELSSWAFDCDNSGLDVNLDCRTLVSNGLEMLLCCAPGALYRFYRLGCSANPAGDSGTISAGEFGKLTILWHVKYLL